MQTRAVISVLLLTPLCFCTPREQSSDEPKQQAANLPADTSSHEIIESGFSGNKIVTGKTKPAELIAFAKSLTGIPYQYGSSDPSIGFDCSGFITYVFNHFNIAVPRSSVNFSNVETEINLKQAKSGDLILFTGTDSTVRTVGHMGIVIVSPDSQISFIHSTSGKANGVTETPLNEYYMGRYVKTIRVFPQNNY